MNEPTLKTIIADAVVLLKSYWLYLSPMINSLSDEEFNKIPEIKSEEQKRFCELYGVCDMVYRGANKYTNIYIVSTYIFRGGTKTISAD